VTDNADKATDMFDLLGDATKSLVGGPVPKAKKKAAGRSRRLSVIRLDHIELDPNTRPIDEDYAQELADSIREHGLNYPILVRPIGKGKKGRERYTVLPFEGGHRYRAHVLLKSKEIPCIVDTGEMINVATYAIPSRPMSAHDQFQSVINRRRSHPNESAEEISNAIRVPISNVQRSIDIQDYTHQSMWSNLEGTPTQDMLVRLHASSNVGRDLAELHRRDEQIAWWAREGWIVKRKRHRTMRKADVRRKLAQLSDVETYLGSKVKLWLSRSIGDPDVETSVRLAPPPRRRASRRSIRHIIPHVAAAAE